MEAIWDWSILDGCFGETNISPSDVDGMVERNGHHLFLETKGDGVEIPMGQWLSYKSLAKKPRTTVIIIWGERNTPTKLLVLWGKLEREHFPASCEILWGVVHGWYEYANSHK